MTPTGTERVPLLAYHGDVRLKRKTLARITEHRKLDQLVQGTYWGDGKGCAVGCTVRDLSGNPIATLGSGNGHELYPTVLGIPEQLARLEDMLFEGLDEDDSKAWPERFTGAIPVGAEERRPFKPAHSDGWDPGVVRTVVSESVANTPNAGRLVSTPCATCGHFHRGGMGEHFTIEWVYPCGEPDCDCDWTLARA